MHAILPHQEAISSARCCSLSAGKRSVMAVEPDHCEAGGGALSLVVREVYPQTVTGLQESAGWFCSRRCMVGQPV